MKRKQLNNMDKKHRFSLRKSHFGVVSVAVGMCLFGGLTQQVYAEEAANTESIVDNNESAISEEAETSIAVNEMDGYSASPAEKINVDFIAEGERTALFTEDWKIHRGDISEGESKDLNDTEWKRIDLPNDYSIDQPFDDNYEAESGFLPGGVQWYRKSFVVPEKYKDKKISIEFDGVYMHADVYLNGKKLGDHRNGYTAFAFDLTPELIADGKTENVLAVKTDNRVPSSRWYSGSGIYRDVHITVTDKVHVGYYGTKVETPNLATEKDGDVTVNVAVDVQNDSATARDVVVKQQLLDSTGKVVATAQDTTVNVTANTKKVVNQTFKVNRPTLWDVTNPAMYKVRTTLMADNKVLDTYDTDYGFRYFNFERETGFSLNGKKMKLKGVSMHHDQGALGAVANPAAIDRQVRILKEMGANAIRVTHNPAATALINSANKHGMLVINEAFDGWSLYKNGNVNDYSRHFKEKIAADNRILNGNSDMTWAEFDLKAMIHSSKNAPSVIMWSVGNEIDEGATGNPTEFPEIARNLVKWIKETDATRKITIGNNRLEGHAVLTEVERIIHEAGGIIGKNYKSPERLAETRRRNPEWILYGSETASAIHSRGIYNTYGRDNNSLHMSEYDNNDARVGWGHSASEAWKQVILHDWNAGEFVWTGFDYIGEPTPWNGTGGGSVSGRGAKPKSSYFGIVDTAGFPKDTYYLYRSLWNEGSHTLNLMSTWNNNEIVKNRQGKVQVDVFTDAYRVELYLNEEKIGEATATEHTTDAGYKYQTFGDKFYPTFYTDWKAGTLSVRAFDKNGKEITNEAVGRKVVKTSGEAASLKATVDRREVTADGRDLAYVTIDVLDANGNPVPAANNRINFEVQGNGTIVGVDNGDPTDTDSYKATNRRAFSGKALVIVQTSKNAGNITVNATSEGLKPTSLAVTSIKPTNEAKYIQSYEVSKNYYAITGAEVALPKTLKVHYSDGSVAEVPVTWKDVEPSRYNQEGSFSVEGRLANSEIKPRVNIQVIAPIRGVENFTTFTTENKSASLPEVLRTINSKGEFSVNAPVKWTVPANAYAKVGTVTIQGKATVMDTEVPVTATVRVAEAPEEVVNIARKQDDMPRITNGYRRPNGELVDKGTVAISDKLVNLNNGVTNNGASTDERWTDWAVRNENGREAYLQFDWKNAYNIANVKLYHFKDNNGAVLPGEGNVRFEYLDGTTWKPIEASNITQVTYLEGETPYGFIKPVTTKSIRIWTKSSVPGKAIGYTEVEFYPFVRREEPKATASLAALTVNGQSLDINKADKRYEVDIKDDVVLVPTVLDNASATVVRYSDRDYKVLVKSEDGKKEVMYTVHNTNKNVVPMVNTKPAQDAMSVAEKAFDKWTKIVNGLKNQPIDATKHAELTVAAKIVEQNKAKALAEVKKLPVEYRVSFKEGLAKLTEVSVPTINDANANGILDVADYENASTAIVEAETYRDAFVKALAETLKDSVTPKVIEEVKKSNTELGKLLEAAKTAIALAPAEKRADLTKRLESIKLVTEPTLPSQPGEVKPTPGKPGEATPTPNAPGEATPKHEHKVLAENLTQPTLPYYDLEADNDGDGYSNYLELVLGTNPNEKGSVPTPKLPSEKPMVKPEGMTTEKPMAKPKEMATEKPMAKPEGTTEKTQVSVETPTTVKEMTTTATLPETGEADAYLVFGAAAMAILAGVGLLPKRKEMNE